MNVNITDEELWERVSKKAKKHINKGGAGAYLIRPEDKVFDIDVACFVVCCSCGRCIEIIPNDVTITERVTE